MDPETLNDPDLIRRAQHDDQSAIEALSECCFAYSHTLSRWRNSTHEDSEDIAQVVRIKFHLSIATIKPEKGAKGWVAKVAYREWVNFTRKNKHHRRTTSLNAGAESETWCDPPSREPNPSEQLADNGTGGPVLCALQQLSPRQQAILIHRLCLGLSAEETAGHLGITEKTVYAETRKARVILWNVFGQDGAKLFEEPEK